MFIFVLFVNRVNTLNINRFHTKKKKKFSSSKRKHFKCWKIILCKQKLLPVRKAAKLAVYDEIIMRVKNHHIPATIRVDTALSR